MEPKKPHAERAEDCWCGDAKPVVPAWNLIGGQPAGRQLPYLGQLGDYKKPAEGHKDEGRKDDGGKTPHHLLPYWYLEGTARVLGFGAQKYTAWNWYQGMQWSRVYRALIGHMLAWWWGKVKGVGEPLDKETGMSHLWHAGCCLSFLMQYEQEPRFAEKDDRPT